MNFEHLEAKLSERPLYGYFFLKTRDLTFTERVRWICQHECQMYGKTWACPPAVGSVEACQARCMAYPDFLLICTVTEVDDISDISDTLATRAEHETITRQVEALVRAEGQEVYTLSTEACAICSSCAYPGGPCRHPEQMHPCIESHGILLTQTAEECGIPFQYGDNVVTWFSMIFYRPAAIAPQAASGATSKPLL